MAEQIHMGVSTYLSKYPVSKILNKFHRGPSYPEIIAKVHTRRHF